MTIIEGNRDEADKCIEIALNALKQGNVERGEKFLNKAETLYPTQKAKDILNRLKAGGYTTSAPKEAESAPRRRNVAEKPEEPKLDVDYTKDQLEMVTKLKK